MKRFTETEKWRDPWFRKLLPIHKMLWLYLLDNCDNAGVVDLDMELASFQIGGDMDVSSSLDVFGDRIHRMENGKLWIPKFIRFQCGELSEDSRPHQYVIRLLKEHSLWILYARGIHTPKEQDKEQDKEKEPEQEPEPEPEASNGNAPAPRKYAKGFTAPSMEMCQREAKQLGMPEFEGEAFHNYYATIGWVRGKNLIPIKEWTPLMCSWRDGWKKRVQSSAANPASPSINSIAQADSVIREALKEIQSIRDRDTSYAWDGGIKAGLKQESRDRISKLNETVALTRNLKMGLK